MTTDNAYTVDRNGNAIVLPSLGSPFVVGNFIRAIYQGRQRGYDDFSLDFSNVKGAFPNACTPIAGLLEYYHTNDSIDFEFLNVPDFLKRTNMLAPAIVGADDSHKTNPMNTVWKFSSAEEIHSLVDAYLDTVSRAAECSEGVLQGLEWCLNEVMDNVLQHAATTHGYAMGQVHQTSQHAAICIYDHGQGLFNSLRETSHSPASAVDAITVAMQEGVTRDKNVGQGNGMWGLHNIVRANSGFLNITSGPGFFGMGNDSPKTSGQVPFLSHVNNCTTVDFQLDFDKGISVADALGGYEPVNLRIENLEDDRDNVIYQLADKASGTGTRQSGSAIRNEVLNIMRQTDSLIVVDFGGVSVVSSSFADEFIGKLAIKCGFISFNQRFRLIGMNETVQAITNRSVSQRLQVGLDSDLE